MRSNDRIGPDFPLTQFPLYFKYLGGIYCKRKFKKFGKNSQFRPGAIAVSCSNISIGENTTIRPGSRIIGGNKGEGEINIGNNVLMGCDIHIYCSNHNYDDINRPISHQGHSFKSVNIEDGCWLGANCVILYGVTIGRNSVVGAGSIVTKDVPPYTVVAGNPAKIIKSLI